MPIQKITETEHGSTPSKNTNFLITQPEINPETGKEIESLRRVNSEEVSKMLKNEFKVADSDDLNKLRGDLGNLSFSVSDTDNGLDITYTK